MKQDYVERTNKSGEKHYAGIQSVGHLWVESQILERGDRDFTWTAKYINGRDIASGTSVSLKQAKYLAGKAFGEELAKKR
jgi:hypothetical protein